MASDEYADRLAALACQLIARVRDDQPQANDRWLRAITTPAERHDLLYVLAAAVPDDQPWPELTAWTLKHLNTHGSEKAA